MSASLIKSLYESPMDAVDRIVVRLALMHTIKTISSTERINCLAFLCNELQECTDIIHNCEKQNNKT